MPCCCVECQHASDQIRSSDLQKSTCNFYENLWLLWAQLSPKTSPFVYGGFPVWFRTLSACWEHRRLLLLIAHHRNLIKLTSNRRSAVTACIRSKQRASCIFFFLGLAPGRRRWPLTVTSCLHHSCLSSDITFTRAERQQLPILLTWLHVEPMIIATNMINSRLFSLLLSRRRIIDNWILV